MSEPVYCPECEAPLPPSQWSAPGPVRCRRCGTEFVPPPRARDENPRPRRRPRDVDDWEPRRRNSNLPVVILVAGIAFGVGILTVGVGVAAYFLAVRKAAPGPVAVAPPPIQVPENPAPAMAPVAVEQKAEPARGIIAPPGLPRFDPKVDLPPHPGDLRGPGPAKGVGPPPVGPAPIAPAAPVDFNVPPTTTRVEITPAPLAAATTTVSLPAPVRDVCVGGDGRFVLLNLGGWRQIAVLDTSVGKVVKFLPAADDPVLMAAGMDKLVLIYPGKNLVQRWNLLTFERELTAPLPAVGTIARVGMGSASAGPVYLTVKQEWGAGRGGILRALDLTTLKVLTPNLKGGFNAGGHPDYPAEVRVSADGATLGMWNNGLSPSTLQIVRAEGDTLTGVSEHTSAGAVLPGPDGSTIFTGIGLYSRDAKPKSPQRTVGLFLPAAHGAYHLLVENFGASKRRPDGRPANATVKLFATGDPRPLLTLNDVDGLDTGPDPYAGPATTVPLDKRVLFVPKAEVLVSLAGRGDKVYLRKLNIDAAIDASGVDYLYLKSPAVADAERGTELAHPIEVKARKGGVKVKLESGPDGMKLDGTTLRWRPPLGDGAAETKVILTITDAAGQELLQTLTVRVHEKGKLPKMVAAKTVTPGAGGAPPAMVALKAPPPAAATVSPPALPDGKATIKLPAAADDTCFGGGGRFLILRLPTERKLAVFDVTAARVVKHIPLAEAEAKFAAGLTDLIVGLPGAGVLQRWSLTTFEKELTVPAPAGGIGEMAMGSASAGPLLIEAALPPGRGGPGPHTPFALYDPRTLRPAPLNVNNKGGVPGGAGGEWQLGLPQRPRFSADGRLLVGAVVYVRTAAGYESTNAHAFGTPGPEGRHIYGTGRIWTPEGAVVGQTQSVHGKGLWFYAAAQGPYYFSMNQVETTGFGQSKAEFRLHVAGDTREIYVHPDRTVFDGLFDWIGGSGVFGTHIFCVPDAELLIVLAKTNDALVLHKLDLKKGLEKAGRDLLYVADAPPPAERGTAFKYLPAVRSTKGGVKAKLESAPEGMKLTADGLTWDVPKDFAGSAAEVLLTIADASGQELFHSARVVVTDAGKRPAKE